MIMQVAVRVVRGARAVKKACARESKMLPFLLAYRQTCVCLP
jgi:hypothetical protein